MLHAKKLKRRHKEFLVYQGLNHHDFWLERETAEGLTLIEKKTGKLVDIRR